MTLESQYKQFLKHNPDSTFSFKEWMKWHSHQMEQAIIQMMQDDEELGLYDYDWCKGNVVLPKEEPVQDAIEYSLNAFKVPKEYFGKEEPTQRLEKYSERFDNKNNQIVSIKIGFT